MPRLAFIKYMVTRDICMRLCAACQTEALATALLSSRDLSDISALKDEHTDGQCCVWRGRPGHEASAWNAGMPTPNLRKVRSSRWPVYRFEEEIPQCRSLVRNLLILLFWISESIVLEWYLFFVVPWFSTPLCSSMLGLGTWRIHLQLTRCI